MDNITQWDLGTYFGLMAAVMAVVGALKSFFPKWIDGKEPTVSLALSYILGISTKLFIPGAYKSVNWIIFLLTLLVVAAGAKFGHDHLINEVIGKKDDQSDPPKEAP
jgi:hypothetical protein